VLIFIAAGAFEIACQRNGRPTERFARVFVPPASRLSVPADADRRHLILHVRPDASHTVVDLGHAVQQAQPQPTAALLRRDLHRAVDDMELVHNRADHGQQRRLTVVGLQESRLR
jgi:hypothetical protein